MMNTIQRMRADEAFTLIELLIVILILGLLLAIALPTFLNQQDKAKDSQAKMTLNTAYKIAKGEAAVNDGVFPSVNDIADAIEASEPRIWVGWVTSAVNVPTQNTTGKPETVYIIDNGETEGSDDLKLASRSASGTIYTLTVTNGGSPVINAIN